MARRHISRILDVPSDKMISSLVVTAAAFGLGVLMGFALAASVNGGGGESLRAYLESYLEAAKKGMTGSAPLPQLIWETARWPVLTILLSFTALGVVGIPIVFAARGFLLSFAVASFVRAFGGAGGGLAFLAFGMTSLLAVPALFVLGVQGFLTSRSLAARALGDGSAHGLFGRAYLTRCGICAGVFSLAVMLDYWVVPALLEAVSGGILA